jgi:hypothetical protein
MSIPKITHISIDNLDQWWETNPEPGDVAIGIDTRNGTKYFCCVLNRGEKPKWMPLDYFVMNKKQYTVHRSSDHCSVVTYLYGKPIDKHFFGYERDVDNYTEQLKQEGYEIAFTDNQVQEAQEWYDYVMSHRLIREEGKTND